MKILRIATRGSRLAMWQAEHVANSLRTHFPALDVQLRVIKTQGDKILDVPLAKIGGKGLFVKEIEESLLVGDADLAVHSMKDVPAELPEGLKLGIVTEREVTADCLVSARYNGLDALPSGATVGTCSLRRQAQLLHLRPDLKIVSLRGNLDTRMKKLLNGDFDAIMLAMAGLRRLGLSAPYVAELAPPVFYPAVAQGALGIEFRNDRAELDELLGFLDHSPSRICVEAERAFLFALDGGCQVPIAGLASLDGNMVHLTGLVGEVDGKRLVRKDGDAPVSQARELGTRIAEEVLAAGGRRILDELYQTNQ